MSLTAVSKFERVSRLRPQRLGGLLLGTMLAAVAAAPGYAARTGAEIFMQEGCSECHGDEGGGNSGPALAHNNHLSDTQNVVRQVLLGSNLMPTFGKALSDDDIAAVLTYVRSNWGNRYPAVQASDVVAGRQANGVAPGPAPK